MAHRSPADGILHSPRFFTTSSQYLKHQMGSFRLFRRYTGDDEMGLLESVKGRRSLMINILIEAVDDGTDGAGLTQDAHSWVRERLSARRSDGLPDEPDDETPVLARGRGLGSLARLWQACSTGDSLRRVDAAALIKAQAVLTALERVVFLDDIDDLDDNRTWAVIAEWRRTMGKMHKPDVAHPSAPVNGMGSLFQMAAAVESGAGMRLETDCSEILDEAAELAAPFLKGEVWYEIGIRWTLGCHVVGALGRLFQASPEKSVRLERRNLVTALRAAAILGVPGFHVIDFRVDG